MLVNAQKNAKNTGALSPIRLNPIIEIIKSISVSINVPLMKLYTIPPSSLNILSVSALNFLGTIFKICLLKLLKLNNR